MIKLHEFLVVIKKLFIIRREYNESRSKRRLLKC